MSTRRVTILLGLAALLLVAAGCSGDGTEEAATTSTSAPVEATESTTSTTTTLDPYDGHTSEVYEDPANWICRPDLDDDPCRDLDVTRIEPDGTTTVEARTPAEDPPVDCFYVYPTVSADPGVNSDREVAPGDNEVSTVVAQAAQFGRTCRVFAPIYRQVTLSALGSGSFGEGRDTAYADVLDAWQTYVSQYSEGRGVILIGHSQGAGVLRRLIAEEIDGVGDVQDRLVAAHLYGTSVQVAEGNVVGGDFDEVPGCTAADQTGCVVTFSSYSADVPPPADALFGQAGGEGSEALCTDPLALLGRDVGTAIAPVQATLIASLGDVGDGETRFVLAPHVVTASCAEEGTFDYLRVALADPDDPRPVGPLVDNALGPTWGLHLADMIHVHEDLVDLAAQQSAAYVSG